MTFKLRKNNGYSLVNQYTRTEPYFTYFSDTRNEFNYETRHEWVPYLLSWRKFGFPGL